MEDDPLFTNRYISTDFQSGSSRDYNNEFRSYIRNKNNSLDALSLLSVGRETTSVPPVDSTSVVTNKKLRIQKNYVNIDSRDRDLTKFPKANHFTTMLGGTFYNVTQVQLISIEFPNTNAVVNNSNNYIYWRNLSDIQNNITDNITHTYPVYKVQLRVGSYVSSTLTTEIESKLDLVKRDASLGQYHYFTVNIDQDTDVTTFTSLIVQNLKVDPLSVTAGIGIVSVTAQAHGYSTGDTVYMIGCTAVGGIPAAVLNTSHTVTVINSNSFQFEVNVNANNTVTGGGNVVQAGSLAPFQLLFGDYPENIGYNLGFQMQNSSQEISCHVRSIQNLLLVKIVLATPIQIANTSDYINHTCTVSGTNSSVDGTRTVMYAISSTQILVSVNSLLAATVYNQGSLSFNGTTVAINSLLNYDTETLIIETVTPHNYNLTDLPTTVTLNGTVTTPEYNIKNNVFTIPDQTHLVIPGYVLAAGGSGSFGFFNPLRTHCVPITNVVPGVFTRFTVASHNLVVGDYVSFYDVSATPPLHAGYYIVYAIPDADNIIIDIATSAVDKTSILNGTAYLCTRVVTVTFPNHGFNYIFSISGNASSSDPVEVTTILPHGLVDGQSILLSQTNCSPTLDSTTPYVVSVTDTDTFTVTPGFVVDSPGTFGLIGINTNEFTIYNATSVGGIDSTHINGKPHQVREIVDENTFSFVVDTFASSTAVGGGNSVYISSLLHGFSGVCTNTVQGALNRSVNIAGENYAFICSPQLNSMKNTGLVNNIFARVQLDRAPGTVVFNSFLCQPKLFEPTESNLLSEVEFSVQMHNGDLYEFNDLDYSFVLEIDQAYDSLDIASSRLAPA